MLKIKDNIDLKELEKFGFRVFKRYSDYGDELCYRRERKRFLYNEFVEVFERHIRVGISYNSKSLFRKRLEKMNYADKAIKAIKDLIKKGLVE